MEEDWIKNEEEDEEEIEKIEKKADNICKKVTNCEDCPWEVCGDLCEVICDEMNGLKIYSNLFMSIVTK